MGETAAEGEALAKATPLAIEGQEERCNSKNGTGWLLNAIDL